MRYTVYKIHLTNDTYYIGCTERLAQRLYDHGREWHRVEKLLVTNDILEASNKEQEAIKKEPKAINKPSDTPYHILNKTKRGKARKSLTVEELLNKYGDIE